MSHEWHPVPLGDEEGSDAMVLSMCARCSTVCFQADEETANMAMGTGAFTAMDDDCDTCLVRNIMES